MVICFHKYQKILKQWQFIQSMCTLFKFVLLFVVFIKKATFTGIWNPKMYLLTVVETPSFVISDTPWSSFLTNSTLIFVVVMSTCHHKWLISKAIIILMISTALVSYFTRWSLLSTPSRELALKIFNKQKLAKYNLTLMVLSLQLKICWKRCSRRTQKRE